MVECTKKYTKQWEEAVKVLPIIFAIGAAAASIYLLVFTGNQPLFERKQSSQNEEASVRSTELFPQNLTLDQNQNIALTEANRQRYVAYYGLQSDASWETIQEEMLDRILE